MTFQKIGSQLRGLRKSHNLTQVEVAERAGLDQSHLSEMEAGRRRIGVNEERLVLVLGEGIRALWLDEQVASANTRALAAKIEQAITALIVEAYPKPVVGWTEDPTEIERMNRELSGRAEELASKDWAAVLVPEKVAQQAGLTVEGADFELVKQLCMKWITLLSDVRYRPVTGMIPPTDRR